MKNKIISAMLVGMSATMAVPVTAVMAAEGEPAATEATAAEAAVTEETPAEETPVEEAQAEEAAPEDEAEEVQEEEAIPQVDLCNTRAIRFNQSFQHFLSLLRYSENMLTN